MHLTVYGAHFFDLQKLAYDIDTTLIAKLVSEIEEKIWLPHQAAGAEDASISLIAVGGVPCLDYAITGAMQPTTLLEGIPELKHLLWQLDVPLSRCRLVRLAGKSQTPIAAKHNYHWFRRVPIYIPLITNKAVQFVYDGEPVQMRTGEAWTFDTQQSHGMMNHSAEPCIHLVVETKDLAGGPGLEPYSFEVLTAAEFGALSAEILATLRTHDTPSNTLSPIANAIDKLQIQWATAFTRYGHHRKGELAYQDLVLAFNEQIGSLSSKLLQKSDERGSAAIETIKTMLLTAPPKRKRVDWTLLKSQRRKAKLMAQGGDRPVFDRPLFIVSAPRAGSTLLFETLSQMRDVWTIGIESHATIEGIPSLHPAAHGFASNQLGAADAAPDVVDALKNRFAWQLEDRTGAIWLDDENRPKSVRFLEKTPKNALRIPFLKAAFPDARFIYLYREPIGNISSMLAGWRTRRFVAYPQVAGWPYRNWSFLLTPGWQSLKNATLVEIVAHQWQMTQQYIQADLAALEDSDWVRVDYADLTADPQASIRRIADFANLRWDSKIDQRVSEKLPASRMVLSAPNANKWRKNAEELATVQSLAGLLPKS